MAGGASCTKLLTYRKDPPLTTAQTRAISQITRMLIEDSPRNHSASIAHSWSGGTTVRRIGIGAADAIRTHTCYLRRVTLFPIKLPPQEAAVASLSGLSPSRKILELSGEFVPLPERQILLVSNQVVRLDIRNEKNI